MVIVDCIVLHYLRIRASKINMALARMDKLVKKLMSNPADDVGHSSMLASIKLKKRENHDDLDFPPNEWFSTGLWYI